MKNMTSRERVAASLEHKEPDKVPIDFGGVHTSLHDFAHRNLKKYLKLPGPEAVIQETLQQIVHPDKRIMEMFQNDVIGIYPKSSSTWTLKIDPVKDEFTDEWGTRYVRPKNGYFYDIKDPAMKDFTIEDLKNYKFPDPGDKGRVKGLRKEVLELHENTDKALIMYSAVWGPWESLWLLRGFEQAYIDIAGNIKFVELFFEKILGWTISFWENVLSEVGDLVNVVQISDDLGTQRGPMFNPDVYRLLLKPCHKELVDAIKAGTNAKIYFHTCGSVYWAINDFIDCGIDILNPVQVGANNMDSKTLKRDFGDRISFWGGGCDINVISNGTPEQVKEEVKKRMTDLSPGGGFVFASIHNIQANTPPENIFTMYDTAVKYREYG
jgi:uroporphyrinogen decarboxylase